MTPNTEYELNHREFVVLGLVAEFPSHAYSINQRIDERGMRAWTSIGKSSIYSDLNNLEEKGLVDSYREEVDEQSPYVSVYQNSALLYESLSRSSTPDVIIWFAVERYADHWEQLSEKDIAADLGFSPEFCKARAEKLYKLADKIAPFSK